MTRVVVLCDLDDTLFQTVGKCRGSSDLTVAALDRQGRPLSFMTPPQRILFGELLRDAWVVPATARSREAYGRVALPFGHGAIVDFGGLILTPDGGIDQAWWSVTAPQALLAKPLLEEVLAKALEMTERGRLSARARLVVDDELPFYVVVKTEPDRLEELDLLAGELKSLFGEAATVHLNGNNLAVLPPYLDKGPAAAHFLKTHVPFERSAYLLLGLGDSLSDLGFLDLCDFRMVPASSQLGRRSA